MTAGRLLVAILLLGLPSAGAQAPKMILPEDEEVWTRFSLLENLETKHELENATFQFDAGRHHRPAFIVFNNHTEPIHNVTLTLIPRNATFDYRMGATYAGDPPQGYYAHWSSIASQSGGFVGVDFWIPQDEGGPFQLDAFVTFEDGQGVHKHSRTAFKGEVAGKGAGLKETADVGSQAIGAILATIAAASLLALRRHKGKTL